MKLTSLFAGQLPSHVLFDLDGTLVDSAPDLTLAVDRMLMELGREPVGEQKVRAWVGNGTEMLIRRALAGSLDDSEADRLPQKIRTEALDLFMNLYTECNGERSMVYEGVVPFVQALARAGIKIGVVTNKLTAFTDQLLERANLAHWFEVRVCGDTLAVLKPDPAPLRHALEQLGGTVIQAMMIGDSETDINTARAAGIPCVAVSYGYNHGKPIREQGADLVVDSLTELL
jgi:phosphoglycolate phosphatase